MKNAIGRILHRHNMTQSELAERIEVSKGFVSEIISGRKRPSVATLQKIAEALQVPIDQLYETGDTSRSAHRMAITGFTESDLVPLEDHLKPECDALLALGKLSQAPANHPALYRTRRAVPAFSILAGDILLIDLKPNPLDGQAVLVQVTNPETGEADTRLAIWRDGSAWPAFSEPAFASIDATLVGAVSAVVRLS